MNTSLITKNVLQHLAAQAGAAAVTAAFLALTKVDYSALGLYAPMATMAVQTAAALATAITHEYLGTAPKSP